MRLILAFAGLAVLAGCGPDARDAAGNPLEKTYCYDTLAGIECYDEPRDDDGRVTTHTYKSTN